MPDPVTNKADETAKTLTAAPAAAPAGVPPASAATTTLKGNATVALGLTFNASDTRKFGLDVTAMTKVSCEMVSVPPPRQLMALVDKMAGLPPSTSTDTPT